MAAVAVGAAEAGPEAWSAHRELADLAMLAVGPLGRPVLPGMRALCLLAEPEGLVAREDQTGALEASVIQEADLAAEVYQLAGVRLSVAPLVPR
jgi:hypothetical protein